MCEEGLVVILAHMSLMLYVGGLSPDWVIVIPKTTCIIKMVQTASLLSAQSKVHIYHVYRSLAVQPDCVKL